ncbi:MAG: hypothetical protein WC865_13615 [Bacteroidales bacterium]
MDVQEIISAFGAYYENSGQNKARVKTMLTQGQVTPGICMPVKTDDTVFKLAKLSMQRIVQPFQKGWTPRNAAAITPNEIRLFHFKVDEDIWPDDVEATWLGFLESESLTRKDWPLVKYLIETGYIPQINQDMELFEYGKGIYAAPTPGESGITGSSMDGFVIQLQRGVDNETINSVPLGALDKDTIYDQIEQFVDGITQVYQGIPMSVFMSQTWRKHYLRNKRENGHYFRTSDKEIDESIDFTNQRVVELPCLNGTDVIFATPKENILHLTKKSANKTRFSIEESKREVSFLCDWWEGMGFGMNAAVWTNVITTPPIGG